MTDIYDKLPQFLKQLEQLDYYIGEVGQTREVRRIFGNYTETVQKFRINGLRATVFEKFGPHRIRYRGPIPILKDPKKLTFFNQFLEAYETEERQWTRMDSHRHVNFP